MMRRLLGSFGVATVLVETGMVEVHEPSGRLAILGSHPAPPPPPRPLVWEKIPRRSSLCSSTHSWPL